MHINGKLQKLYAAVAETGHGDSVVKTRGILCWTTLYPKINRIIIKSSLEMDRASDLGDILAVIRHVQSTTRHPPIAGCYPPTTNRHAVIFSQRPVRFRIESPIFNRVGVIYDPIADCVSDRGFAGE